MPRAAAPPAVIAVRRLLERAVALRASDLHLDPREEGVVVTARRDGVLEPLEVLPLELLPRIVGRLKALADLLAYRTDVPQEGRIGAARSEVGREFRVATFPTPLGERVALRLDVTAASPDDVSALGLPAAVESSLREALARPEGVVLLTGPSGSGKTTTLYAAMREVAAATPPRSVLTIEDPIERRIPTLTQTQVDLAAGLTIPRALQSLLRQDPDAILVGEIRDRETAGMVLEAGLTGHLVGSTLHAGTGPKVFTRLAEMGIEPFVVTTAVAGVLAQRLVRRLAPDGTYAGRTLVAEWLPMGKHVRRAVLSRWDASDVAEAARLDGWVPLAEAARELVTAGVTTEEEVRRVVGVV